MDFKRVDSSTYRIQRYLKELEIALAALSTVSLPNKAKKITRAYRKDNS